MKLRDHAWTNKSEKLNIFKMVSSIMDYNLESLSSGFEIICWFLNI